MNVRMMPPQGPMGQPQPMGPAPMPQGMPPAPMSQQQQAQASSKQGLGSTFGGNAQGRGQFKQFMSSKKQQPMQMPVPQVPQAQMPQPMMPMEPQPMLPTPQPTNIGSMRYGVPQMGGGIELGRPMRGTQGGLGSAPVQLNRGGAVPRRTDIYGQDHMLAYIRPDEAALLQGLGGMGTPGPGGIPQYGFWDSVSDFFGGGSSSSSSSSSSRSSGGRSEAEIQADINQALKESGGSWTSELNDLVAERDVARSSGGNSGSSSSNVTSAPINKSVDFSLPGSTKNIATINYGSSGNIDSVTYGGDSDYGSSSAPAQSVPTGSSGYPSADALAKSFSSSSVPTGSSGYLSLDALAANASSSSPSSTSISVPIGPSGYPSFDAIARSTGVSDDLDAFGGAGPDIGGYDDDPYGYLFDGAYDPIVSTGTGQVTLDDQGDIVEYGTDFTAKLSPINDIKEMLALLENIGSLSDEELARLAGPDTEKTDAQKVQELVDMGVDRNLAVAQVKSGADIGQVAGIDAYDFGFDGGLTQPSLDGTEENPIVLDEISAGPNIFDYQSEYEEVPDLTASKMDYPEGPFVTPDQTGLEQFEETQYLSYAPNTTEDFMSNLSEFEKDEINQAAEDYYNTGAGSFGATQDVYMPSDESFAAQESDLNALDLLAEDVSEVEMPDTTVDSRTQKLLGVETDGTGAVVTDGQTLSDLYLSAMKKLDNPETMTEAEQRALYGARGQVPNAAESAYLQNLLRDARHKEDGPIGPDGKPIYEAGDYVVDQTGLERFENFLVKAADFLINPLTILGDKYSFENMNIANVQEQLDAYKSGGTFVYDDTGRTVIGVAKANYDADGDGIDDTVAIFDESGDPVVTGDAISITDITAANTNDNPDDDIEFVDADKTFTNTEEGVVEGRPDTPDLGIGGGDDNNDPCPEGYYLDPVTQECVPIDVAGTEAEDITLSLANIDRSKTGGGNTLPPVTPTPTPATPMKIRVPKQYPTMTTFSAGGAVTPNIDRFLQSLGA